jgi:hypothetical protein
MLTSPVALQEMKLKDCKEEIIFSDFSETLFPNFHSLSGSKLYYND